MDVTIPKWNTLTLRSDGAFAVWTVLNDGSLDRIVGPGSSTDRKFVVRSYSVPIRLRVVHKDNISVSGSFEERDPDHETLDKTPLEVPLMAPMTLQERINEQIRYALEQQAEREGYESPEEAADLDVDEDPEPLSQYELTDMQDEVPVSDLINDLKGPDNDEQNRHGNVHVESSGGERRQAGGDSRRSGERSVLDAGRPGDEGSGEGETVRVRSQAGSVESGTGPQD